MTELKNRVIVPKGSVRYMLIALPTIEEVENVAPPINKNYIVLDHSYCINPDRLSKGKKDYHLSIIKKREREDANKVAVDCAVNSIIKEEIIIPDDPEVNVKQEILLDVSCKQTNKTKSAKKSKKVFARQKIKKKIHTSNKIKSSNEVENVKKSAFAVNVPAPMCNNLKSVGNTIVTTQDKTHLQAETPFETDAFESTLEITHPIFSSTSMLKPQTIIVNSDTNQNVENSVNKAGDSATSILKLSNLIDDKTSITINDVPKIANLKPCLRAKSFLKSATTPASMQVPLILKLPITEALQTDNVVQMDNMEKDKSTAHTLNMKEKQIVITNRNFTEIKKEVVEADIEEEIANIRTKRFYHAVCTTCKKLKEPNNPRDKCKVCQNTFQYECLRCRDVLSSKDEYYNHLKIGEFCSEICIPSFLRNDSYALASRLERYQCSEAVWERTQKLVSIVRKARINLKGGKFNRIKLCCPFCDETQPVESGNFWCIKCNSSSVFKCQTCNRNYTTYCSAIYHTDSHVMKKPIYECNDCPFKHKKKRSLFNHIRDKHLPKVPKKKKKRRKVAECPDCNLIITSKCYWRKHLYTCRERIYFKCTLCSEKYLDKEEIRSHLLVAHQMTNSQVIQLIKEIEEDRKIQEEKKKRRNRDSLNEVTKEQNSRKLKNIKINDEPKCYGSSRYIAPYCVNCNKIYEDLKVTDNNNCPKCKLHVGVQCTFCKQAFRKYITAYYHIRKRCEKIKIVSMERKNDRLNKNAIKVQNFKKLKKHTKVLDLDIDNQLSHSILEDQTFINNAKELKNNSTLEDTKMHLVENNDIKVENQDIKVFDSLLNFDNYELIIPDKFDL